MAWAHTYASCFHRLETDEIQEYERLLDKDFKGWDRDGGKEVMDALERIAEENRKQGNRRTDPVRYPRIKSAIIAARMERRKERAEDWPTESCGMCAGQGIVMLWPQLGENVTPESTLAVLTCSVPCLCSLGDKQYGLKSYEKYTPKQTAEMRRLAKLAVAQHASMNREVAKRHPDKFAAKRELEGAIIGGRSKQSEYVPQGDDMWGALPE